MCLQLLIKASQKLHLTWFSVNPPSPGALPGEEPPVHVPDQDQEPLPGSGRGVSQGQCNTAPSSHIPHVRFYISAMTLDSHFSCFFSWRNGSKTPPRSSKIWRYRFAPITLGEHVKSGRALLIVYLIICCVIWFYVIFLCLSALKNLF